MLNQPAADRLGVRVGDAVLLRLPTPGAIPADSALGKKRETVRTERVTVGEIIAAEGLGAFSLRPTQRPPSNAYVALGWLERLLDQPGRVNAMLLAGEHHGPLAPDCSDYGLRVERTASGYWNITSDRMILDPATEREILKGLHAMPGVRLDIQPAITYLANTLACNGHEAPYSTITAIDFADRPPLGPFRSVEGKPLPSLGPNKIALNSWAADRLHARVGDTVRVAYFEPDSLNGEVREKTAALRLAAVVQLAGAADDRDLTPAVKGMTDELTMANWDPPFPFDAKRIRPADEEYWDHYGPTPKAFVSLATGRRLWGSRFGQTTSLRVDVASKRPSRAVAPPIDLRWRLQRYIDPAAMGFVLQPIRRQQLAASEGTTPFGVLFLCFSFFIIAAAIALVALLFRLEIDRRAVQIGTLLALGLPPRMVRRMLLGEGLAVVAVGSLLGVPAGVGYAALMLAGLQTWWLAAIATPFLRLHVAGTSLAIGCASGFAVAGGAIWFSVRRIARVPPRRLLAGVTSRIAPSSSGKKSGAREKNGLRFHLAEISLVLLAVAPTALLLLVHVGEEMQTGLFFSAGALALATLLALARLRLGAGMTGSTIVAGRGNLVRMAMRNAAQIRAEAR